ncbi:MAG: hypothetical protein R6V47_03335 [Candidatus Delongbacteria bacterium]
MKFFSVILISAALMGTDFIAPVKISDISFRDAVWDDKDNIYYSEQKISNITDRDRAVVLYLFDACYS